MNFDDWTRDDWVVAGLALALAILLFTIPWYRSGFIGSAATGSPDGWLGLLAVLAALAIVADLSIERGSPQTEVPSIGSRPNTRFLVALVVAGLLLLKFLLHLHFSGFGHLTWGFYVDVIVAAALVWMALQVRDGTGATFSRPSRPRRTAAPAQPVSGATRPGPAGGVRSGEAAGEQSPPSDRPGGSTPSSEA